MQAKIIAPVALSMILRQGNIGALGNFFNRERSTNPL
jgi:hypothetical protein